MKRKNTVIMIAMVLLVLAIIDWQTTGFLKIVAAAILLPFMNWDFP